MPSYKVLNPLAWHGRHERGEILEMSEAEAQAFGPDYLESLAAQKTKPAEEASSGEPDDAKSKKSKK